MISILIPSKNEPNSGAMIKATESCFPYSQIITCNDRYGYGKGWAVREALKYAEGAIICFIDGDLDIHPRMIYRLLPFLDDYDIVVGRKVHRNNILRRAITVLSRIWVRAIFNVKYDTQTGIKVFKREALPEWETDGWMFDAEIMARACISGKKIIEVPVETTTSKNAKVSSILKCLIETIKIKQSLC